jgi:hypothetical protein
MVLAPSGQAHEQKTLTVIMLEDGIASGNITDPSFVQGNAVWFRMEDSTENTTMRVRLDLDMNGVYDAENDTESGDLVNECELDENGTLVDDACAVSFTHPFAANTTVGNYTIWILRTHNGTEETWTYFITVHEDVHVEDGDGPSPGDCFGLGCEDEEDEEDASSVTEAPSSDRQSGLILLSLIALVGMASMLLSIRKERLETEKTDPGVPSPESDEEA